MRVEGLAVLVGLALAGAAPAAAQSFAQAKKGAAGMTDAQGVAVDENGKPINQAAAAADSCPLKDKPAAKREEIIRYVIFETLSQRAGFGPEADWKPKLYILGNNPNEKKVLKDYGLEKGLAFSYDPQVEINNTDDHVVMLSTRLWDDKITCTFDELGFVIGHELAHHKLKHMSNLAQMKKEKFGPWWEQHKGEYRGACPQDDKKERELCGRKTIWPKFIADTPDIASAARQQERDADSYGSHWMDQVSTNYSKEDAQHVLARIKEYELRENIPPTDTYDSAEVRAVLLNRGF